MPALLRLIGRYGLVAVFLDVPVEKLGVPLPAYPILSAPAP